WLRGVNYLEPEPTPWAAVLDWPCLIYLHQHAVACRGTVAGAIGSAAGSIFPAGNEDGLRTLGSLLDRGALILVRIVEVNGAVHVDVLNAQATAIERRRLTRSMLSRLCDDCTRQRNRTLQGNGIGHR